MYFYKIQHPNNFTFAKSYVNGNLSFGFTDLAAAVTDHGEDCFHLQLSGDRWSEREGLNVLTPPQHADASVSSVQIDEAGSLQLLNKEGATLLESGPMGSIGIAGSRWLVEFAYDESYCFYGMGEKTGPLEKTGKGTKFWNTDVFADFTWDQCETAQTDPMYVSIPYLIIRTGHGWVGVLVDSPYPSFCSAGGEIGSIANQQSVHSNKRLYLGAEGGLPSLWIITAENLSCLTQRFQRLVGPSPMPPLWALGHHQCRWGYSSADDLRWVKKGLADEGIPNSGLWLDIEYMVDYRVFSWNSDTEGWGDVSVVLDELQQDGQRVVPILDPGVKKDPGYEVYEHGNERDVWCKTEDGVPYVGYVWPGETLFPDYLRNDARAWWASWTQRFAEDGIHGVWCDMNDPSVGPVELSPMCFNHGQQSHEVGHNQYGSQMARATRAGLQAANPDERPFVLSRSGYTGCQQHTALWTGDNFSNWTYLKGAIPCSLNLALSGVPLNGPDVPGFANDADEGLALRWYQAGFLFPFLRNHAMKSRGQEPFTYARPTREAIRHLIRLRYRLLPYLYQLWIAQAEQAEAVMRPLIHDFDDDRLTHIDDQFLIGPALLQAPLVEPGSSKRSVILPDGWWFDLRTGEWMSGGRYDLKLETLAETPLYARSGAVIPMQPNEPTDHHVDLARVDLHCFLRDGESTTVVYYADDGASWDYQQGKRSTWRAHISAQHGGIIIRDIECDNSWRALEVRVVIYGGQQHVNEQPVESFTWRATGRDLTLGLIGLV